MRVAAVQFKARKGDPQGSRTALRALAEAAADRADLVVLPEMAVTGYVFPDPEAVRQVAEPPQGDTYAALAPVARAAGAWIVCGFPERAGARLFNSAMVIDPSGALAFTYRKTLLYEADLPWATPGDSGYRRFVTDAGTFGVGICMDLNDDRFVRWCARSELDAVAFPTNWVQSGEAAWPYWADRMALTPAALVAANTWGTEGQVSFSGASAILQRGQIRAHAPREGDAVIHARIRR